MSDEDVPKVDSDLLQQFPLLRRHIYGAKPDWIVLMLESRGETALAATLADATTWIARYLGARDHAANADRRLHAFSPVGYVEALEHRDHMHERRAEREHGDRGPRRRAGRRRNYFAPGGNRGDDPVDGIGEPITTVPTSLMEEAAARSREVAALREALSQDTIHEWRNALRQGIHVLVAAGLVRLE